MKKYNISDIYFDVSKDARFNYDLCVVDYCEGLCYITNLREKKVYAKSYGHETKLLNPIFIIENLEVATALPIFKQGYYLHAFSDRANNFSLRELYKLQRFVDTYQKVEEKSL